MKQQVSIWHLYFIGTYDLHFGNTSFLHSRPQLVGCVAQLEERCPLHIFPVLRSTCSWRMTIYVGKLSAARQPTRSTQPFILPGSSNRVVSYFIRCVLAALFGVYEVKPGVVHQPLSAVCGMPVYLLDPSIYSAALRGGCCVSRPAWQMLVVLDCMVCQQSNKQKLLLLLLLEYDQLPQCSITCEQVTQLPGQCWQWQCQHCMD